MAYTTSALIKKILQVLPTTFPNIRNEEVTFVEYEKQYLQYNNIDTGTQVVKGIKTNDPTIDSAITLNDLTLADLTPSLIVPNTVIVASDVTLTTVYVENWDYIIDYDNGKIKRASSASDITNGQVVYVSSLPYTELTAGSDYNIDLTEGSLVRRAGTSIPDGATVYVDYSHSQVDVSDNLIDEVILEVDAIFDNKIKPVEIDSSDKALESAATYYSMYLICLSQAQKSLRLFRTNSDDVAKIWISLSQSYLETSNSFLSKYKFSPTYNNGKSAVNENATFGQRKDPRFRPPKSA